MVFVTHGEEDAALTLADRIARERRFRTHVPEPGETWELGGEGSQTGRKTRVSSRAPGSGAKRRKPPISRTRR